MTKKKRLAVIDADCFMFYAGWGYRDQMNKIGVLAARKKIDKMIDAILQKVEADAYIGFYGAVSKVKNFRYDVASIRPYKGNRRVEEWQEYFKPYLKGHYQEKWSFTPVEHIEADDAVIIAHHQFKDQYEIIHVGEDKDMKQLGDFRRYNPRSKKIENFTWNEHRRFFWQQMLMGDQSDNIGGVQGIGKANALIKEIDALENPTEEELFELVKNVYINKYGKLAMKHFTENYLLLHMLDKPKFDYPENPIIIEIKKENKYSPTLLIDI